VIDGNDAEYVIAIPADRVNVTGFTIRNGKTGIYIQQSDYNIISENIVTDNFYGIDIFSDCITCNPARENTIRNNIIKNNRISITIGECHSNVIYHNDFINNTAGQLYYYAGASYPNVWDNGYPSGGNYWSDYNGTDLYNGPYQNVTGGDGIGDTPYKFPGTPYIFYRVNQDDYPLVSPWSTTPPLVAVLSPQNKTYTRSSVPLTFTVNKPTSWMSYSLDNQANATINGNSTLTGLSEGPHVITVYANDTSGNMGSSNLIYFTIDTTPLFPIWAAGIVTAGIIAAVAIYLLKIRKPQPRQPEAQGPAPVQHHSGVVVGLQSSTADHFD